MSGVVENVDRRGEPRGVLPADRPRAASELRVLVLDERRVVAASALADLFAPGDVVVVNDAATLPASLRASTSDGAPVELRLVGAREGTGARFTAALLGRGDHRTRTEDRSPPPRVRPGERLGVAGGELVATVVRVSPFSSRLVDVDFALVEPARDPAAADLDAVWSRLYRAGRPVQYAHVPAPLALWDVQNVWASRPWAVEMPSAGRVLRAETLLALRRRGVAVARVTHAAGLSSTGDPDIDARLPLPERFEVPEATMAAALRAHAAGRRVVAVGTSVVRALESAARMRGRAQVAAGGAVSGITDLRLGPDTPRLIVDAVVTGVHEPETSHFDLLRAFASRAQLDLALALSEQAGMLSHELGDAWLLRAPRASLSSGTPA